MQAEPTLTYAHLEAAQLIAVVKRAAAWVQGLMLNLHGIEKMRSEKVCGLARELPSKPATFANTHAHQCCERTLDGSIVRKKFQWSKYGFCELYKVQ
ncbi:unnamed protein product [Clonostachys rosea f. rosea IK726]|uniref:Uncharacterized protein n=2 Tax=Bionectria ochroleuca TaxID=29856 RepID=A0A0B7JWD2_BIOOC|nr:unnamed protein product [Clonostachys rosea f. rosea IK726]